MHNQVNTSDIIFFLKLFLNIESVISVAAYKKRLELIIILFQAMQAAEWWGFGGLGDGAIPIQIHRYFRLLVVQLRQWVNDCNFKIFMQYGDLNNYGYTWN